MSYEIRTNRVYRLLLCSVFIPHNKSKMYTLKTEMPLELVNSYWKNAAAKHRNRQRWWTVFNLILKNTKRTIVILLFYRPTVNNLYV